MVLVPKFSNLAFCEVEDTPQIEVPSSWNVSWRGHASSLPLEFNLLKLSVVLPTDTPTPVVVLLEEQLLKAERLYILSTE